MTVASASVIEEALVLVRIGEGADAINLHSGIGRYGRDGIAYLGAGSLIRVEEITNRSGLESTQFRIVLSRASVELQAAALKAELRDRPVRVSLLLRADGEEEEFLLKQGQVSSSFIDSDNVGVEVYTPMTDLTRVREFATLLTREHQRNYVDATDSCCDSVAADAIKEITWP